MRDLPAGQSIQTGKVLLLQEIQRKTRQRVPLLHLSEDVAQARTGNGCGGTWLTQK
ncbi:MAG: hypothetical protein IPI40_17420 [Betaproteobacteria bacterium]|nr:hypothetical protein [Betaproteobacteria bacterium]